MFGEISTGAQNDLEKITGIAYNMVTVYGMSEKLGNLSFYESNNPYYGAPGMEKKYGEETAHLIDREVKEIVESAAASVRALLEENRDKLERLAGELLAKEMLQYCQIEEILGKRPGGGNSEHEVDCSEKPEEEKPEIPAADSNGKDPEISEEELLELQAAAERLKESRNASEN